MDSNIPFSADSFFFAACCRSVIVELCGLCEVDVFNIEFDSYQSAKLLAVIGKL
jgi:hypothetical protein